MAKTKTLPKTSEKHVVRTGFAALCGFLAIWLLLSSILVVWLNRTVTDTNTYVSTVAPLIKEPAVQDYVADTITDQAMQSAPLQELATTLIPEPALQGITPEQMRTRVESIVHSSVKQVISSDAFVAVWESTNRNAHAALIGQIRDGSQTIQLDLKPLVQTVQNSLQKTELAPVTEKLDIPEDAGEIDLQLAGTTLANTQNYYSWFKGGAVALVMLAVLFVGAAVALSVHHAKTLRRLCIITAIFAAFMAVTLSLPHFAAARAEKGSQFAASATIVSALTHNLFLTFVFVSIFAGLLVVGSKLYDSRVRKSN